MKELIEYIASSLVDNPDEIKVKEVVQDDAVVYQLSVAREDLGKVIGKQGRTARSVRALLTASAARDGKKARLEILE